MSLNCSPYRQIKIQDKAQYLRNSVFNEAVIQDPEGFKDELLQTIDGEDYVCFYVDPEKYNDANQGSHSILNSTGNGSYLSYNTVRRGFNVLLDYPYFELAEIVSLIGQDCIKNNETIIVKDYVKPEPLDLQTGYTNREGIILFPIQYSGSMNPEVGLEIPFYIMSFTLTFVEYGRRIN